MILLLDIRENTARRVLLKNSDNTLIASFKKKAPFICQLNSDLEEIRFAVRLLVDVCFLTANKLGSVRLEGILYRKYEITTEDAVRLWNTIHCDNFSQYSNYTGEIWNADLDLSLTRYWHSEAIDSDSLTDSLLQLDETINICS